MKKKTLLQNKQWIEDIDLVLDRVLDLSGLQGKSVLITGATGLICSAVVDVLLRFNDRSDQPVRIYAAGRDRSSMEQRFGSAAERDEFSFVPYDAAKTGNIFPFHSDYIIHGAGNAYPARVMKEPVETMLGNILGLKELLDHARETGTERVLYISSSEIYGQKEGDQPYREGQYGYIDLLNPRNSYSVGKRAAETLCVSYENEYGVGTVIVRPGHIYGPTATQMDTRVSSAWAYAVVRGEDIVMKSDGSQLRSYCYCLDCASAILTVLTRGQKCHAYNIADPETVISIRQMAEILTACAGSSLRMELPTDEERKGFNPMSNSSLDGTSLADLGWHGCFDAETGFAHTVQILKDVSRH